MVNSRFYDAVEIRIFLMIEHRRRHTLLGPFESQITRMATQSYKRKFNLKRRRRFFFYENDAP